MSYYGSFVLQCYVLRMRVITSTVGGNLTTRPPVLRHIYVKMYLPFMYSVGRCSVVGIATDYRLDGPGIESRWGARFSASVQTGPGALPGSCTMGTVFFPGIKSGRGVTLTPHPLLVPLVIKEYSYTSTPPIGRTACTEPQCLYKGDLYHFTLPFM